MRLLGTVKQATLLATCLQYLFYSNNLLDLKGLFFPVFSTSTHDITYVLRFTQNLILNFVVDIFHYQFEFVPYFSIHSIYPCIALPCKQLYSKETEVNNKWREFLSIQVFHRFNMISQYIFLALAVGWIKQERVFWQLTLFIQCHETHISREVKHFKVCYNVNIYFTYQENINYKALSEAWHY